MENLATSVVLVCALAGCSAVDDRPRSVRIESLIGERREDVVSKLGNPKLVVIEKGINTSYWSVAETEYYAGPSNRQEVAIVNGERRITQTQGMKLKERRHHCTVTIVSNANLQIVDASSTGNAAACSKISSIW
jgi:hypothetical protein